MFCCVTNMFSGVGGSGGLFCFLVGCEFVFTEFGIGFDCGMFEANDIVFLVFNFGKFVLGG